MPARTNPQMRVPTMPNGTEVASYATYLEAQGAVDYLSDRGFDVKSITIVGTDLHMVERVTGRLTMGRVVGSGAGSGALWGTFMGLMLSFAATGQSAAIWLLLGVVGGGLVGALMSGMLYAMAGGQRDFTSQSQVVASRYAVLASTNIDKAFDLLQKTPGNQVRPRRERTVRRGPTEYGSRADEQPRFGVRIDEGEGAGADAVAPEPQDVGAPSSTPTPGPTPAPREPDSAPDTGPDSAPDSGRPARPQYGERAPGGADGRGEGRDAGQGRGPDHS